MKSVLLIYHFFHPDTVISARLFSDLAEELAKEYDVTVFTGNRLIRSDEILAESEEWKNVKIQRFSRPDFSQGSNFGRLFNSAILQLKWLNAFRKNRKKFDTVIIGTDPQFAYMMFPFMRLMNKKVRLIHWVFDLYPEAILVNSPRWMKLLAALTKPFIPWAYRSVDDMVDIGGCMRERLQKYKNKARYTTLTPWALAETAELPQADPEIREKLFGKAKLGLLYSGTVGYAHDLTPFIELARKCRKSGIDAAFCFAGYGNRYKSQTAEITEEDTNIRLAGFASEEELEKRLSAADIHMVSLRPGWEGIVVPSKFFGSLAIGRPSLYSGPETSEIAMWNKDNGTGFLLDGNSAEVLKELAEDPGKLSQLRTRCFECYANSFSKKVVLNNWKELLRNENRTS